jgi:hypothetical protein
MSQETNYTSNTDNTYMAIEHTMDFIIDMIVAKSDSNITREEMRELRI